MTTRPARNVLVLSLAVLAFALVPGAGLAAKGGNGGGNGSSGDSGAPSSHGGGGGGAGSGCTASAPSVSVDNNWAWGSSGSWGMPGEQLAYAIKVTNNDAGCGSSSFAVTVTAPSGFAVSLPASTVTLNSPSSGYVWMYVTSPGVAADGDYPLGVSVQRAGASVASTTTYYKLYSSDSLAPTLFWENPWDGATVSGRSYNVTVASSDDHAVKKIELYIDNAYVSTKNCDNVTYICQLYYTWSIRRVHGRHTVTFRSTDALGNVGSLTATATVN